MYKRAKNAQFCIINSKNVLERRAENVIIKAQRYIKKYFWGVTKTRSNFTLFIQQI